MKYTEHFNLKNTPQSEPMFGQNQVKNEAGGYVFELDKWKRLERFLILGTEGNTFYVSEQKLTRENTENLISCIKEDGVRVVNTLTNISTSGRAIKNSPALFALALVCALGDQESKNKAYANIKDVARIGTHLFEFCQYIQDLRGWSRGLRSGISKFYTSKSDNQLAYQLIKYRQRNGWTHKDVLRLAHTKPITLGQQSCFSFLFGKEYNSELLESFDLVQKTDDINQVIKLIETYKLPREAIQTNHLNDIRVWEALLEDMPITALVRNLGKMTNIGLLKSNLDSNVKYVRTILTNPELIKKSLVHPMSLFTALTTYKSGRGDKGSLSWTPVMALCDSLEEAFYLSFKNVTPTNKNILLAVDTSGSMNTNIQNSQMTARDAALAMALVTSRIEPNCEIIGYDSTAYQIQISNKASLSDLSKIPARPHNTDCSLPMLYALEKKLSVDAFIQYTDNQTWAGNSHPQQRLEKYRASSGINSKNIVVTMVPYSSTIVSPKDQNSLNVVGFDTVTPSAISEFIMM